MIHNLDLNEDFKDLLEYKVIWEVQERESYDPVSLASSEFNTWLNQMSVLIGTIRKRNMNRPSWSVYDLIFDERWRRLLEG